MPWRTIKPNKSLNAEQKLSRNGHFKCVIGAEPNGSKVGQSFSQNRFGHNEVLWFWFPAGIQAESIMSVHHIYDRYPLPLTGWLGSLLRYTGPPARGGDPEGGTVAWARERSRRSQITGSCRWGRVVNRRQARPIRLVGPGETELHGWQGRGGVRTDARCPAASPALRASATPPTHPVCPLDSWNHGTRAARWLWWRLRLPSCLGVISAQLRWVRDDGEFRKLPKEADSQIHRLPKWRTTRCGEAAYRQVLPDQEQGQGFSGEASGDVKRFDTPPCAAARREQRACPNGRS